MIISFVWLGSSRLFIQWLMTLHFVQRSFFVEKRRSKRLLGPDAYVHVTHC